MQQKSRLGFCCCCCCAFVLFLFCFPGIIFNLKRGGSSKKKQSIFRCVDMFHVGTLLCTSFCVISDLSPEVYIFSSIHSVFNLFVYPLLLWYPLNCKMRLLFIHRGGLHRLIQTQEHFVKLLNNWNLRVSEVEFGWTHVFTAVVPETVSHKKRKYFFPKGLSKERPQALLWIDTENSIYWEMQHNMHLLDVSKLCQALNLNGGSALCKYRETKPIFQMKCKRYRNYYRYCSKKIKWKKTRKRRRLKKSNNEKGVSVNVLAHCYRCVFWFMGNFVLFCFFPPDFEIRVLSNVNLFFLEKCM